METRRSSSGGALVAIFVAVLITNCSHVSAQRYTCWGGCYNECLLRSSTKTQPERLSCYYQCLNTCVPRTPADFQYYCEIGCNLENCRSQTGDGAKMEKCFEACTDRCKQA